MVKSKSNQMVYLCMLMYIKNLVFQSCYVALCHQESPLAQLRKASSVQSLQSPKRKFERSTILGELPLPLSLASRSVILCVMKFL